MKKATAMLTREDALAGRRWYVIDARGQVLGRIASEAAKLLRGKGKPTFTPHVDCGDFVIVLNAAEVVLTGTKEDQKVYYRHSEYPGGIRSQAARRVRSDHPDRLLRSAVQGMLPKNRLGRKLGTKLKIYAGDAHPHAAQTPVAVSLGGGSHA